MPGLDQSGPAGRGPMTGRRMGRCTNFGANSSKKRVDSETADPEASNDFVRGQGLGRGFRWAGRGNRNRFRGGC